MLKLEAMAVALLLPTLSAASSAPPPQTFAGVPFGATLKQVKARFPDASRNPDSDKQFEVYMVSDLRNPGVKSAAAFNLYRDRLIGGQILLSSSTAEYWLKDAQAKWGPPDSCTYCEYADMATARWRWPNGTSVVIEGGGMLSIYTAEGATARQAWISRGESGGGEAASDEPAEVPARRPKPHQARAAVPARPAAAPRPKTWYEQLVAAKRWVAEFIGF